MTNEIVRSHEYPREISGSYDYECIYDFLKLEDKKIGHCPACRLRLAWPQMRVHISTVHPGNIIVNTRYHDGGSANRYSMQSTRYVKLVDLLQKYEKGLRGRRKETRLEAVLAMVSACDVPLNVAKKLFE